MAIRATPVPTAPKQTTPARRGLWHAIKKHRWAYAFISPFYILFLIFGVFPILYSLFLSFHEWNLIRPMEYVGLKNYNFLLGPGGSVFWHSIGNGIILFLMYVPIMTFLAIVLAVILNSPRVRGFRVFRTMYFAPYVTSMIAAGFTFRILLENNGGLFNVLLETVGLPTVPWLESVWGTRVSLSLLVIWGWLGFNMVLMLTGLQTIPRELNEAAYLDGGNSRQVLFHITIPLLRPIILFSVILSTIGSFGLFNEVMALGGSGPQRAILTPLVHIYGVAFGDFNMGRASAMAYVYFALIAVLTFIQFRYIGREER
jgi:ABC-type sugar transport system permease subunit